MSHVSLGTPDSVTDSFGFGPVPSTESSGAVEAFAATTAPQAPPPLGALKAFTGTFQGRGFNTIFRPDSPKTPTKLPFQVTGDNLLELNLTEETLSFSPMLGTVPNRGEIMEDTFLNGVPYLQTVTDITVPNFRGPVIHVEPGLWMIVQRTSDPLESGSLVRMASIPHGTTISAQGGSSVLGSMDNAIKAININPFSSAPGSTQPPPDQPAFNSQTVTNEQETRIPQNLGAFVAAGTITQAMLTDPATFIRSHSQHQTMTSIVQIHVSTAPAKPLFGGGISNIAFLLGDTQASNPNAQAASMNSTFWIQTVEYTIQVPVMKAGESLTIAPEAAPGGAPVPGFLVTPPAAVTAPRTIKATATQIQYSQLVMLNFNGLTWPHASVATLVPQKAVPVPATAFQ